MLTFVKLKLEFLDLLLQLNMLILQLVIQLHVRIVSRDGLWLKNILLNLGIVPVHHKVEIVHQLF